MPILLPGYIGIISPEMTWLPCAEAQLPASAISSSQLNELILQMKNRAAKLVTFQRQNMETE